ncbi:MAG: GTP 3',8-cyclase MoaA [Geobacteraceae bacterium]|nr:GTP 3',8-cyclase MoaA [Geobacteraceae bacterium]
MELTDSFGRRINYLRLSVTDRCNLRCRYCMPEEGVPFLPHGAILSYEELFLIARTAVSLGIEKIRVTGGEPLVRKGIVPFLARLAKLPGLRHLALTTNGLLLEEMAQGLRAAGVQRLNISLDSLQPDTFAAITRGGEVSRVMAGIAAAERAGFPPVKINMVVMRGVNDQEIIDFAALTLEKPYAVRFIEYMPTAGEPGWQELTVPGREILERIARVYPLCPVDKGESAGPAKDFRIEGAAGTLGFITPVFGHFCGDCNRIRVTATGMARGCLFSDEELDLKPFLRGGDEAGLEQALRRVVSIKQDRHRLSGEEAGHKPFDMSKVGG